MPQRIESPLLSGCSPATAVPLSVSPFRPRLAIHHRPSETAVAAAEALIGAPGPRIGRPPLYDDGHWAAVAAVAQEGGTLLVAETYSLSYSTAWKWCRQAQTVKPSHAAQSFA